MMLYNYDTTAIAHDKMLRDQDRATLPSWTPHIKTNELYDFYSKVSCHAYHCGERVLSDKYLKMQLNLELEDNDDYEIVVDYDIYDFS